MTEFSIQYQVTFRNIWFALDIPVDNAYNYGLSYFIEIVDKDIVLAENNTINIKFLIGIGKTFQLCILTLNFSNFDYEYAF